MATAQMSIETVDTAHLDRLPDSHPATGYLSSLIERGPFTYLDNAKVRMEALLIDGKVIPIVIGDGIAGNSNVCSVYTHYCKYTGYEFARRFGRTYAALMKAPSVMLAALFRIGSIDRVVYANNWLLTTNPRHRLSSTEIARLTRYLIQRYPDSALIFRSLNPVSDRDGFQALQSNRYRFVASRRIYLLETANRRYLERNNVRIDLAKLKQTSYTIVGSGSDLEPHAARFAELHRELYLGKYTPLNPQYNTKFFSLILRTGFMTNRAFIKDGRVDAYISFYVEGGVMTASLIAYDLKVPRKLGLYRKAVALLIAEAAERKALVNLSAGAGEFKMLRGGEPVQEYDAIFDRHLPAHRRLPWACLGAVAHLGRFLPPQPRAPAKEAHWPSAPPRD